MRYMVHAEVKDNVDISEMMEVFGRSRALPGTAKVIYMSIDGRNSFALFESDDPSEIQTRSVALGKFVNFTVYPLADSEEAGIAAIRAGLDL